MENNFDITKPRYNKQSSLTAPWPFVISWFHHNKDRLKPLSIHRQRKITLLPFIQPLRERSENEHAPIPNGIVGDFDFTFFQRNLKERHKRPWTRVCEY